MVSIVTDVEVAAPPERVWQLLMDFDRYREWHPFVELGGDAVEGGELSYTVRRSPKASMRIKSEATITRLEHATWFQLKMGIPRLTWINEWYALERSESGTHLTHGMEFRGMLAFIFAISRKRLTPYFRAPIVAIARRFAAPAAKPAVPSKPVRKGGLRPPNVPRRRRR